MMATKKLNTNKTKKTAKTPVHYVEAIGRRKTSVARVRLFESEKQSFEINEREFDNYFPVENLRVAAMNAFKEASIPKKFKVTARIHGGGISSQSEALSLGVARALIKFDPAVRKKLKKAGLLKRDAREKERRKFGLKKARKAAQWSKR